MKGTNYTVLKLTKSWHTHVKISVNVCWVVMSIQLNRMWTDYKLVFSTVVSIPLTEEKCFRCHWSQKSSFSFFGKWLIFEGYSISVNLDHEFHNYLTEIWWEVNLDISPFEIILRLKISSHFQSLTGCFWKFNYIFT